jgi:hypothetical protein
MSAAWKLAEKYCQHTEPGESVCGIKKVEVRGGFLLCPECDKAAVNLILTSRR